MTGAREHILEELGEWKGADPETGFQLVETADGRVHRIADLVNDNPARRDRVAAALRDPCGRRTTGTMCTSSSPSGWRRKASTGSGAIMRVYDAQKPTNDRLKEKIDTLILGFKNSRWHYESRVKGAPG